MPGAIAANEPEMTRLDEIKKRLAATPIYGTPSPVMRLSDQEWYPGVIENGVAKPFPKTHAVAKLLSHAPADLAWCLGVIENFEAILERIAKLETWDASDCLLAEMQRASEALAAFREKCK
jgi:hypothetical protein